MPGFQFRQLACMSVCFCLCVSVSVRLDVCTSVSVPLPGYVCVPMCVYLCVCVSLCMYVCVSEYILCVCLGVSVYVCVPFCMCFCVCVVSQRLWSDHFCIPIYSLQASTLKPQWPYPLNGIFRDHIGLEECEMCVVTRPCIIWSLPTSQLC